MPQIPYVVGEWTNNRATYRGTFRVVKVGMPDEFRLERAVGVDRMGKKNWEELLHDYDVTLSILNDVMKHMA